MTMRRALLSSAYPSGWEIDSLTKPVAYTWSHYEPDTATGALVRKQRTSVRQEKLFQPERDG